VTLAALADHPSALVDCHVLRWPSPQRLAFFGRDIDSRIDPGARRGRLFPRSQ